jgi:hypothetical protein
MPIEFHTRLAASGQGSALRRPAFVLLPALIALVASGMAMPASAAATSPAAGEQSLATRVVFSLPPSLKYELLALKNPERLVVDFPLRRIPPAIKAMADHFDRNDSLIKAMRYGQFKPGIVRVVFDLKQEVEVSAEQSADTDAGKPVQQLALRLQGKAMTSLASASAGTSAGTSESASVVAPPAPAQAAAPTAESVAAASTATQPTSIAGDASERIQQYTPMPRARNGVAEVESRLRRPMSLSTQTGFDIGLENSEYRWRDWASGQPYSQATSSRVGMSVGFTQVFEVDEDDVFVRVESGYSTGNTTRKVRSAVNPDALKDAGKKSEPWWDSRLIVGSDWNFRDFSMAPYIGIGYRALKTTAALNLPASGTYRRDIQHHYLPIGLTFRHSLPNGARLSSNLEYDHFVSGKVTSYYAEDPETNAQAIGTVKNALKKGLGVRGSVMYEQDPWSIGPFFRFWKIGASDSIQVKSVYDVYEGINKSYEIGVNARYRF